VDDYDASGLGFGTVIHQGIGAIANFRHAITLRHRGLAAYKHDLIGLFDVICHWRPYLWGRPFVIKTDHHSLKYLLDQFLATIPQHHWVGKLLEFDFSVQYKPGHANMVADALSHRDTDMMSVHGVSGPFFDISNAIRAANAPKPALKSLHDQVTVSTRGKPWAVVNGVVTFQRRIYVSDGSPLLATTQAAANEEGHGGVKNMLHHFRTHAQRYKISSVLVPYANRTKQSICTQREYSCRCEFPARYGRMWPWIS
jgi:hypothetical protein